MFKLSSRKQNFTEGPLFVKILLFALPIMCTSILQILYSMADNVIVGSLSGDPLALAAVGSTGALINLVVNLLIGISAGTGVVIAQAYGAADNELLSRATHTSVTFAAIAGIAFTVIGLAVTEPALIAMGTKEELVPKAVLYMYIICAGIPGSSIYNFAAATLRSTGDSKTPLLILSSTGLLNVALNVFFVTVCHMSVEGVALATIISQYVSAIWVIAVLKRRKDEAYAFSFKKLGIHLPTLIRVLKYGVPAALQSAMYSISNVLITSATNIFSTAQISAKTIVGNIDGIAYVAMNSYLHASMTVTAQNYGAKKIARIRRAFGYSLLQVTLIGLISCSVLLIFREPIIKLYIDGADPNREAIINCAKELLIILLGFYTLCGIQETLAGTLRGLGYALIPMVINLIVICGVRIVWIYAIFYGIPVMKTIAGLFLVYPVSWALAVIALGICCAIALKKLKKIEQTALLDSALTK